VVARTLDEVKVDVAGSGSVLSAKMTERVSTGGTVRELVSMLTEVWVRRDDGWRLMGVRIDPLPQAPRTSQR
jgi:hypothetical protein